IRPGFLPMPGPRQRPENAGRHRPSPAASDKATISLAHEASRMISRRSLLRRVALTPAATLALPNLARARELSPPTNFLQAPGTNGYIATPFNLMGSELDSLKNGAGATSSIGGRNGVFTREHTGNAIFGAVYFVSGGNFTPTVAAADFAGWF